MNGRVDSGVETASFKHNFSDDKGTQMASYLNSRDKD